MARACRHVFKDSLPTNPQRFYPRRFHRKVVSNAPDVCPCLRDGVSRGRIPRRSGSGKRCSAGPRWTRWRCTSRRADGEAGGADGTSRRADGEAGGADGPSPDAGTPADAADATTPDAGAAADAADAGPAPDAPDAAAQHGRHAGTTAEFSAAQHGRYAEHAEAVAADCFCTADAADAAAAWDELATARTRHDATGWNSRYGFWYGFWHWVWARCRWHESTGRASGESRWHDPPQPATGRRTWWWCERVQSAGRPRWWGCQPARRWFRQSAGAILSPARPAAWWDRRTWAAARWNRSRWCRDFAWDGRCRGWSAQPRRHHETVPSAWARWRWRWRNEWRREPPDDVARPDRRWQPSDNPARSNRRRWTRCWRTRRRWRARWRQSSGPRRWWAWRRWWQSSRTWRRQRRCDAPRPNRWPQWQPSRHRW